MIVAKNGSCWLWSTWIQSCFHYFFFTGQFNLAVAWLSFLFLFLNGFVDNFVLLQLMNYKQAMCVRERESDSFVLLQLMNYKQATCVREREREKERERDMCMFMCMV